MDPLSAIRQFTLPGAAGVPLPKAAQDAIQGAPIPAADLQKLAPTPLAQPVGTVGGSGSTFESMLGNFVREVNAQQNLAAGAVNGLLSGDNVSLHQAMIAMQEAGVSFQLMVEVRNKLLESYQELMRMQI